jgi:hypothetical protein
MKTRTIKLMLMATTIFSVALMASCSDDDDKPNPADDKTELAVTISQAELLILNTEEGTVEDQFAAGSQATLQEAIDAAEETLLDEDATQGEVNSVVQNLQTAIDTYMAGEVAPIAATDLIARYQFDEGTGTTAMDDSPNNFDGAFKTGHAFWGAGNPAWTTDRHGNANRAIRFDDGAHVEVPYNTKLNPGNITISLWMKQDVNTPNVVDNQYMVAMNRWNTYKFNMQSVPKPFLTTKTASAGFDRDSADPAAGLPQGVWYHLVASFGGGHMKFYVNGTLTKDWTDVSGTIIDISATPVNLTIGQDLPNDKYSMVDGNPNYLNWGGHFIGALDEIRIYKTVLTDTQVTSIYNNEKPSL